MKTFDYDVVIIGAGMVGASLAIALAPSGLRIAVIESISPRNLQKSSYDDRGITLAPSSKRIFDNLGVWQQIQRDCYAIKNIHVSEQGRFGFARLQADEVGCDELGYVVVAKSLGQALLENLKRHDNIDLLCPAELKQFSLTDEGMEVVWQQGEQEKTMRAGLLVGADGSHSLVRRLAGINTEQQDFKQTAIVANVTTQKSNKATAYERFTPHGPIALLPIGDKRSVLVYVVDSHDGQPCMQLSESAFIERVQQELGRRLGSITQLGERRAYPIIFQQAVKQYQPQLVLLGNSAHTLHPNAAQGFNLGLRDVAGLVDAINDGLNAGAGIDDVNILENYFAAREADQKRVIRFTNGLAKTFYNRWPVVSAGRDLFISMVDVLPALKHHFVDASMGLVGSQPRLVRSSPK